MVNGHPAVTPSRIVIIMNAQQYYCLSIKLITWMIVRRKEDSVEDYAGGAQDYECKGVFVNFLRSRRFTGTDFSTAKPGIICLHQPMAYLRNRD